MIHMVSWIGWIGDNLPLFLTLAGTALIVAEAFAPGAHFVVLGVALLVAGLVGLALPSGLGILAPLFLAALVLGAGAITFYVYRQFDFYGGKGGEQTSDSDSLRGATARVTERVTPTDGEVKIEDGGFNPYYRAKSVDGEIAEGSEVIVVDPGGGNVVTVESIADEIDEIDRQLARGRDRQRDGDDGGDASEGDVDGTDEDRRSDGADGEVETGDGEMEANEGGVAERDREFEPDTA